MFAIVYPRGSSVIMGKQMETFVWHSPNTLSLPRLLKRMVHKVGGKNSVEILWKSWLKWSSVASQDQLGLCEPHCMTILSVRARECDWHSDCRFSRGTILDLESGSHWLVGWSWGGLSYGGEKEPSSFDDECYSVPCCWVCNSVCFASITCPKHVSLPVALFFLSFYTYRLHCVCKHTAKDRIGLKATLHKLFGCAHRQINWCCMF